MRLPNISDPARLQALIEDPQILHLADKAGRVELTRPAIP